MTIIPQPSSGDGFDSAPLPEPPGGRGPNSIEQRWPRILVWCFVVFCLLLLVSMVYPAMVATSSDCGGHARDLEQVRGMGNGFTLYYKKYGYFPCFVDMQGSPPPANLTVARAGDGQAKCLAMKLLMQGGFVEDAKTFFCPSDAAPTAKTLLLMQQNLDPRQDSTWATTYAYDPGHTPNHGAVPFFGNRVEMLKALGYYTAHVLTCEQVAKEVDCGNDSRYWIQNHKQGDTNQVEDDIYADDTLLLEWRDAYLQWDVPAELP